MAICNTCGNDYLRCKCPTEPYCDTCAENDVCNEVMDAACVIYHPDSTDGPSKLTNLGMPNGSSAEEIFEAIDDLFGNGGNIPITIVSSASIFLEASGTADHTISASIIVSPDLGNLLEIRSNGVFVAPFNPNYLVKVDAADSPDYLENQIIGGTDGVVSISTFEEDGLVKVEPSLDIICLLNAIKNNDEYLQLLCSILERCNCFLTVMNFEVTFSAACPSGYTLNEEGTLCVAQEETEPTIEGDAVEACENFYEQYGEYGAIVYVGGFDSDGTGQGANLSADIIAGDVVAITTAEVWQNNDHTTPGTTDGNNFGPVNRAGVWDCAGVGAGQLGFTVPVDVPSTKVYYIGIAADDKFKMVVNGVTIVDNTAVNPAATYYLDGGAIFRYWHIYPVTLTEGINYLELVGIDTGGVQSVLAAEIYDNTLAQLQAAALEPDFLSDRDNFPLDENHYSNLNLVFSTRCARQSGTTFSTGTASCPDNTWSLDTTGGDPLVAPCQGLSSDPNSWMCVRTISAPFSGYTATLVWDRIEAANSYTIQMKESAEPDSSYVGVTGSPVTNPSSGTTVSLVITSLTTNDLDFRIRANFDTCSSDWTIAGSDVACIPATIDVDTELPDGIVGEEYYAEIPITGGSAPYVISNEDVPSWMTVTAGIDVVFVTGTPDAEVSGTTVSFDIAALCASGTTTEYIDVIAVTDEPTNPDPFIATVSVLCVNPSGGQSGCASQSSTQLQFDLAQPLTSPITLHIAAVRTIANGSRIKYGQNLIPAVSGNNAYFFGEPAIVIIPAGVTQYITATPGEPDSTTFKFGPSNNGEQSFILGCFESCNDSYAAGRGVVELYFEVQPPNEDITLQFTRGSNLYTLNTLQLIQL